MTVASVVVSSKAVCKYTYPTTVNSLPLSMNFCPDTPTNPVGAGVETVVVGGGADDWLVGGGAGGGVGDTEVGFTVLLAVPGRHWK